MGDLVSLLLQIKKEALGNMGFIFDQ